MALPIGATVRDRQTGATAQVRHVLRVPAANDLCGRRIPAHHRITIAFPDGRYAERPVEHLEPV